MDKSPRSVRWTDTDALWITSSVVHPDPAVSEIICKLESGSGFESGPKLSSVSK
jgi:hypothetical protein